MAKAENKNPPASDSQELAQLRNLMFGAAKQQLEQRIDDLEKSMHQAFSDLEKRQAEQTSAIQQTIRETSEKLTHDLQAVDDAQNQRSEQLNTYADRLSSEIEMAETTHKEDTEQLHSRLDAEVRQLTESFNQQYAHAMEKLEQVTQELSSSKTDRKTLAHLLSAMAVNLESDDTAE